MAYCNHRAQLTFGFPDVGAALGELLDPGGDGGWGAILRRARRERVVQAVAESPSGRPVRVAAVDLPSGGLAFTLREVEPRIEEGPLLEAFAAVLAKHDVGQWRIHFPSGELWWSDTCHELLGIPKGPISTAQYLELLEPGAQALIGEHIQRGMTRTGT